MLNKLLQQTHEEFHKEFEEDVSFDYFKAVYEYGRQSMGEEIIRLLDNTSMHADVIYEVLGAGHHYSTMPVMAGISSKLKDKIKKLIKLSQENK